MWTGRFISLFLTFSLILPSSLSWADKSAGSKSPASKKAVPWASGAKHVGDTDEDYAKSMFDPDFEKCGQDCLYGKGNENISLQAGYLFNKVIVVKQLLKEDPPDTGDSKQDEDEKQAQSKEFINAIGGKFCKEGEDGRECAQRFLWLNEPILQKMRQALIKNSDSVSRLRCTKYGSGGMCEQVSEVSVFQQGPLPKNQPQTPLRAQVAYFPSYAELKEYLREQKKNGRMKVLPTEKDYQTWLQEIRKELTNSDKNKSGYFSPNQVDYADYKKVILEGSGLTEQNAYHIADEKKVKQEYSKYFEKAYSDWRANAEKHVKVMEENFKARSKAIEKREESFISHGSLHENARYESGSGAKEAGFNQVRGQLIEHENQMLKSPRPQAAKGNNNKTVDAKAPQPKVSSTPVKSYDGREELAEPSTYQNQSRQNSVTYSPESFSPVTIQNIVDGPQTPPP